MNNLRQLLSTPGLKLNGIKSITFSPSNIATIIATALSILSFLLAFNNYRRSRRLEFWHRKDLLFLKISELNAKHSETHRTLSRLRMAEIRMMTIPIDDEEKLKIQNGIAVSIKNMELLEIKQNELIDRYHSACSNFTLKTSPKVIEEDIAQVQIASDIATRNNGVYEGALHTFETSDPMQRSYNDKIKEVEMLKAKQDLEIQTVETATPVL